ncbi:MAG TPA: hypothetical protein DCQ47_05610 [Gammaproteobacteria bacterium]|nr:hypothetical protein [Gammaproteobacteria bacterium]
MATFTDENSALSSLGHSNNPVTADVVIPFSVGVLLATITYLVCCDTGEHSIFVPIGIVTGMVVMSLCFMSEKERQMLIEIDEACVSQQDPTLVKSGGFLWLKLQCLFLIAAVPVFFGLLYFGDPVFQLYLETKGAYSY